MTLELCPGVSSRLARVPFVGVGLAELPRAVLTRALRDLVGAATRVVRLWLTGVCTLVLLCALDALALPPETDRVAAVVPVVIERAIAVRWASPRGDSLYSGEERTSGEPQ